MKVSKAGLELYTIQQEETDKNKKKKSETKTKDKDKKKTNTSQNIKIDNITYDMGDVNRIDYIGELFSDSFEEDYSDISNSASISLPLKYLNSFYKGRQVNLKKNYQNSTKFDWSKLKTTCHGFVSEISYTPDKVDIKLNGMTKLLDVEKQFTFKKTKRSEIVKKIIEASGLKAKVNVKGLKDDVTDFTNVSSSSSSSDLKGGEGEEIDSLVRKIVGSETDDLAKCKLIHGWLKENVRYSYYECSRYSSAKACLQNKGALNCADTARLTRAMMSSAGLDAWVVHRSSNNGHFWTLIKINGKIYASDQTGSGSAFNTIWYSDGDRRSSNDRGGNWDVKNGNNPDC